MSDISDSHHFKKEYNKLKDANQKSKIDKQLKSIPDNDFDKIHINSNGAGLYYIEDSIIETVSLKRDLFEVEHQFELSQTAQTDPVFKLHSRPGAINILYIDFDGENIPKGASTWPENAQADLKCAPLSYDSDPTTLSDYEKVGIQEIWSRVANDYAAFQIDVTTERPTDLLTNDRASHIVVSGSRTGLPYNTAGGIGFVNVHGSYVTSKNRPSFCYSQNLGPCTFSFIAECVSHEAGHNMGLHHDATLVDPKIQPPPNYPGHNNWAPIMGVSYGKKVTQWSKGEYPKADNTEDDLAILSSMLGVVPVPTNPTPVVISSTCKEVASIITPTTRSITFSLTATTTNVQFRAYPPENAVGNADLAMMVTCGSSVSYSAPDNYLDTSKTITVTAGSTCTVLVTSSGDPTGLGYSDYGSVGFFTFRYCNAELNPVPITTSPASVRIASTSSTTISSSTCCVWVNQGGSGTSICSSSHSNLTMYTSMYPKVSAYSCTNARIIFYDGAGFTGNVWMGDCNTPKADLPAAWNDKPASFRTQFCSPPVSGAVSDGEAASREGDVALLSWWAWTLIGVGSVIIMVFVAAGIFLMKLRNSIDEEEIDTEGMD